MHMPVTLLPGQSVSGTLKPESSPGVPAPVDGIPEWTSSNPSIASVEPSADGLSARVTYVGAGTSQIGATVDADMTTGTRALNVIDDVICAVQEATTVGIEWGTPEPAAALGPQGGKARR
jgi:hypothetical protein